MSPVDAEGEPTEQHTDPAVVVDAAPGRGRWAVALVVAACVIALLSTITTWVQRQALDTDTWVETTDQLLADEDIRTELSHYLVTQLYAAVPVADVIGGVLPDELDGLANIAAGTIRASATDLVDDLLASDRARATWREVNRTAHELLVRVLDDDTGEVLSAAGGVVSIDLRQLVVALAERIGFGEQIAERIPEDVGQVVLLESDEIDLAQTAARATRFVGALLFLVVLGLFAGAVYVSGDRRRTVRDFGVGLVVVSLLVLLARSLGIDAAVDVLARADTDEPAQSVLWIGSSLLRQVAITQLLVGIAIFGFALLAGPSRVASGGRLALAPLLRHGVPSMILGGAVVFLVLLWLKPGGPMSTWLVALGVGALCVAGVAWVQQLTVREFPDVSFSDVGDRAMAGLRRGVASVTGDGDSD